jgi:hypothetical protein
LHWQFEHRIDAPLLRVEAALTGPEMLSQLPAFLPQIRSVELVARSSGPGFLERTARWQPDLGARLPAFLTPRMLEFDEHTRWDLDQHEAIFEIHPAPQVARRVRCAGRYLLREEGRSTLRSVEGELTIDVPVLGPRMEAAAVRLLQRQFQGEAELLRALTA